MKVFITILGVSFIIHVSGVDVPWAWKFLIMRRIVKKEQKGKRENKKEKKDAFILKVAI